MSLFRKIFAAGALSLSAVAMWAGVLNPRARYDLQMHGNPGDRGHGNLQSRGEVAEAHYIPVIIELESADVELPACVAEFHRRGRIVVGNLDPDGIRDLYAVEGLMRIESAAPTGVQMRAARNFCNLTGVQKTVSNPAGLTGKGVVVGLVDTGFDPLHIAFAGPSGDLRVKKTGFYSRSFFWPQICDTEQEIKDFGTDTDLTTHATHVCGIMAGGYTEGADFGVAYEADIVAMTGELYDAYILAGCEEILDYAKSQGKPAVINLSLSGITGPLDGTTLLNQYLAMLGSEATVCISAGNDGARNGALQHVFSASAPTVATIPRAYPSLSPLSVSGVVDIWGEQSSRLTLDIVQVGFHGEGEQARWNVGTLDLENEPEFVLCSAEYADLFGNLEIHTLPEPFAGYIYVVGEINPYNGRANLQCYFNVADPTETDHYQAKSMFGVSIGGDEGERIDISTSESLFLCGLAGFSSRGGTPVNLVNNFCAGEGAICVGASVSSVSVPFLGRGEYTSGRHVEGQPAYFSSYGTTASGRTLPEIYAPGAVVRSAFSSDFIAKAGTAVGVASSVETVGGTDYYWGPDQGTSMSAPYVAGVAALWLQEMPALTPAQIKDAMMRTANSFDGSTGTGQYAAGMLDALAGLELLRRETSLSQVTAQEGLNIAQVTADAVRVSAGDTEILSVQMFAADGRMVSAIDVNATEYTLSVAGLARGIYIFKAFLADGSMATAKYRR